MLGFKRVIAAAVALALLVAGLSLFLLFTQIGTLGAERAWVQHSRAVIGQIQLLRGSIEDAEQGERGYLVTGDDSYLEPYVKANATLPAEESRLVAMVSDNPGQTNSAKGLVQAIETRRASIGQVIAAAKSGDVDAARRLVRLGEGRGQMSEIRARVSAITQAEADYLDKRTAAARNTQGLTLVIGLTVSFLALATLVAGVVLLARGNRRLARAMADTREAEAARSAMDALTSAIFANVPDYLFVLNVEDGERYVLADINPAFATAMNVAADGVRGRELTSLLPRELAERLIGHYRRVRARGSPVTTRDHLPRFPGGPRVWETIVAPVPGSDGAGERIIGSIRDITERVRAEERLRDAQRMEAVGQLTGGVAHDFNNLLQVIRGNLEMLEGAVAGDERAARRLRNALYGADRAAQLTKQLLAFARRQPLAPQVINLSRLVSDMADLLRRTLGEGVEVQTIVADGLWNTMADPGQVESALLNLALNARDAMPNGGRLTVEIGNAVLDESYAKAALDVAAGAYVMLAVSDTGEGMSDETKARVFEPFFTTKAEGKGTGLGLSMVYGFVKQSSGHIQIYSEAGQGTTVKIYLPRASQPESAAAARAPETARATGLTVLVVEDDASVRAAAIATLDELGYSCLEAGGTDAALAILETGAAVDLVFSDVVMPGSLNARAFAEHLRAIRPRVPILFTSGYTDNAIVHHGR
ncbi:MAG TPA: CHASE3 domain-containing protein, partial [Caulobacteraceae bacterium]|nr:CHASE3 domain-containing protein [Caulobacteraceae bacterium]